MNSEIYNRVVELITRTVIEAGLENKGENYSHWRRPSEDYLRRPGTVFHVPCESMFDMSRIDNKFNRRRAIGVIAANSVNLLLRDAVKRSRYDHDKDHVEVEVYFNGLAVDMRETCITTHTGFQIDPARFNLTLGDFRRICREIEDAA